MVEYILLVEDLYRNLTLGYDKPTRVEGVFGGKYIVQISAGGLHTVVLDQYGDVYTFGNNREWGLLR